MDGPHDHYALTEETAERIRNAAKSAEYALVTASNGLDMAEGLNVFQADRHFLETYGDFVQEFGLRSVLQGLAAPWPSEAARWAFLARFAQAEWLGYTPSTTMRRALALVAGRPHFTVTCNVDGRFVRAGEDPDRVLETEGSIRHLRCSHGCSDEFIPAEDAYSTLAKATHDLRVPEEAIPRCPRCGAPLVPAIDEARAWQPDAAYKRTRAALEAFLREAHGHRMLVLELGIGARNQAIKRPTMELVAAEPAATYVTFNYREVHIPPRIEQRSLGVSGDLGAALRRIVPEVRD